MEKRIETTYTPEGLRRAVQNALSQHLSDADVLRYHDEALPDAVRRERIALHLTVCRACQQRVDAADAVHPPMEDLVAYHDHVIQNPTTLQRVQTHLQQCLHCAEWVDELQQVQEEAVNFDPDIVWQQLGSMGQPHQVSPPAAVAHTAVQRLTTWKERLGAVVTALLHPPLAPAAVHATTTYPRVHMAPGGELTCVINKTEDGGLTLTFETQHVEWAGGLLEFACCTADTGEMLLSGFSVLPEAPRSASESAVCLSPEAAVQLETAFQVVVYPIGLEELTDDDVENLRWSATIAADEASHEAWGACVRRLRSVAPAGSLLQAWAAAPGTGVREKAGGIARTLSAAAENEAVGQEPLPQPEVRGTGVRFWINDTSYPLQETEPGLFKVVGLPLPGLLKLYQAAQRQPGPHQVRIERAQGTKVLVLAEFRDVRLSASEAPQSFKLAAKPKSRGPQRVHPATPQPVPILQYTAEDLVVEFLYVSSALCLRLRGRQQP